MARRKRVTVAEIAKRAGVSTATVSRAISGNGYVNEDLAQRIRSMAEDMDYALTRNFVGKKILLAASGNAVLDLQRSQFTMHVVQGMRDRTQALDLNLQNFQIQGPDCIANLGEQLAQADTVGALFLTMDDHYLDSIAKLDGLSVLVNSDDPDMRLNSVSPCNRSAAALAARHLIDKGHTHILFLNKPGRRTILRRLEGVRDALGAYFDPALVIDATDWTAQAGQNAVSCALDTGKKFSAVIAAGDVLAAGAIVALQSKGLSIPNDAAVIGIDGLPQSEFLTPSLTTVVIPMQEVGAQAVDMLCDTYASHIEGSSFSIRRLELGCKIWAGLSA